MTKKNGTKRSLLMSAVALVLCFSMLVGSTFAWFTDSVTSSGNIIKSGSLEVTMGWADGTEAVPTTDTGWTDASQGAIFNYDKWEPGYVEVRHIKIENKGTLALKYQLNIVANGDVSDLADVIDVYFVDPAVQVADRAVLAAVEPEGTLAEVLAGMPASTSAELLKDESDTVTIALKMRETADNQYQNLAIGSDFSVVLMATQLTAEEDAFDDQYDKDAWHPDFTVTSVEDLAAALANGGQIQVNGTLNAGATQDVPNWTNAPAEFIFDATTLDALKGGKYVLEQGSRYGVVGLISAGESLALSDMEITANSQWPVYLSNYGGTLTLEDIDVTATQGAGIYPYGTNGTTTIKSATVNQKALSDEFASSTPWAGTAIATSNGHNLIIEDGTYIGSTWGVYVYNSGATVTINGGTFKAPKVIQADGVWSTGGNKSVVTVNDGNFDGALHLDWGTTPPEIYINGGNFTNFSATVYGAAKLVIKGGTFDADPSAYVATGYTAVENNGLYYVVSGNVNKVITTAADLQALSATAFTDNNGTAESYTIELLGDIDMGGADFSAMIAQRGDTLTINGNGHKISNVNVVSGANDNTTGQASMFYAYPNSTLNVSDLTLENITVTSEANGTGYAAAVVGFCEGATVLDNVDVVNATVTGVKSSGMLAGHVGNGGTLTATNCDVSGTVTLTDYEAGGHYAGKYIGTLAGPATLTDCTANVTVSGNLNAANIGDVYGRKTVDGSLTIDGTVQKEASSQDGFNNAIASDNTVNVTLAAGNYAMPDGSDSVNLQGKTLTITGTEDTVIDATAINANDQFVTGATMVFDGVTINFGTTNYMGFANTASLTYKNCTINGLQFLYGENVTFENCDLNSNGGEHCVWTYGVKNVSFIDCDFTYGDRGINCYSDNDVPGGKQTVNFTNCTFTTTNTASEGAVEINSTFFSVGIEVNLENCTAPAYGDMAYVSPWDSTNGAKTTINIQ